MTTSSKALIVDIREMPGWNPGTGEHGLTSVSDGKIYWDPDQKAMCRDHGAINCVSDDRRLWRCIHSFPSCGEGCYVVAFPEEMTDPVPFNLDEQKTEFKRLRYRVGAERRAAYPTAIRAIEACIARIEALEVQVRDRCTAIDVEYEIRRAVEAERDRLREQIEDACLDDQM